MNWQYELLIWSTILSAVIAVAIAASGVRRFTPFGPAVLFNVAWAYAEAYLLWDGFTHWSWQMIALIVIFGWSCLMATMRVFSGKVDGADEARKNPGAYTFLTAVLVLGLCLLIAGAA